jgi:hypothetical protein
MRKIWILQFFGIIFTLEIQFRPILYRSYPLMDDDHNSLEKAGANLWRNRPNYSNLIA